MATTHKVGGSIGGNKYGTYVVRYASDKQKNFIKKLLEQKQHNLSVTDETLKELNVQGASDLISQLINLPNKQGLVIPATEAQISFASSLVATKENGFDLLTTLLQKNNVNSLEQLDREQVSFIIATLKLSKVKPVTIRISDVGAYVFNDVVYSIRKDKDEKKYRVYLYSKEVNKYVRAEKKLEVEVLSNISDSDRLTLDKAVKYSAQTGICCHCGRLLTVLKSVAGGIGPICSKKYS